MTIWICHTEGRSYHFTLVDRGVPVTLDLGGRAAANILARVVPRWPSWAHLRSQPDVTLGAMCGTMVVVEGAAA